MTILQEIKTNKKDMYFGINAADQVQKFSIYKSSKPNSRYMLRFRVIDYAPNGKFHNEWSGPLCSGFNKKSLIGLAEEVISRSTTIKQHKPFKKILLEIKEERNAL